MDSEKWPASDFEELYHQRWAIEEGYKLDKSRLEFERWSGKSEVDPDVRPSPGVS
jgi:IS4 transposase